MAYKEKYNNRRWLNSKSGTAFINTHWEATERVVYASVKIADCNRMVTLEFDAYNEKDRKEKLRKIDVLLDELYKLRTVLEEAPMKPHDKPKKSKTLAELLSAPTIADPEGE